MDYPLFVMLDETLRAIAEPKRRNILTLIRNTELPAGEIASRFDVTRPAISQHLKILIDAELVAVRRQGTHRLYRALPEGFAELRGYLNDFWHDSLLKLAEAAEEEERLNRGRFWKPYAKALLDKKYSVPSELLTSPQI